MSKHIFTIEVEFDTPEEYEAFVLGCANAGGDIVNEESDF